MRIKTLFLLSLGLLSLSTLQAQQNYYVSNKNGTYQAIGTKETHQMTFDATQRLIAITLNNEIVTQFATSTIDSISFIKPGNSAPLVYTEDLNVSFDNEDATSYNEIIETIITDPANEEEGDFVENFQPTRIVNINFTENGITVTPDISDQVVYTIKNKTHITINSIRSKVAYRLTGNSSNGSFKIYSEKKFQLALNGVDLTNPTGPAINIQTGKTIYVTLQSNTTNNLCDGASYSIPPTTNGQLEDQKGTLFSEGQLIFSGTGTLNVTGNYAHAICSDDYIRVRSGSINILSAVKDGINTNDMFRVGRTVASSPKISINANNDAIDCGKGYILIEAGEITINSQDDGLTASYLDPIGSTSTNIDPSITIKGGFLKINTHSEKGMAIKTSANYTQTGGIIQGNVTGNGSKVVNCDKNFNMTGGKITALVSGTTSSDESSVAGIKSNGVTTITGGNIGVKCTGAGAKGINSTGNIIVDGGTITLLSTAPNYVSETGDWKSRGITSDAAITMNQGNMYIKAYDNGVASTQIKLNGGTIQAFSTNSYPTSTKVTQTGGWLLNKGVKK